MRKLSLLPLLLAAFVASNGFAAEGMISVQSEHSVKVTADRLVKNLQAKGMTVFKRIDHAAGAKKVGIDLRPTELVIFGNPKVGTPLMMCQRSVAIDLPQKALIWQDGDKVWLSYNDPKFLALRHNIQGCDEVLARVAKALANFASNATIAD